MDSAFIHQVANELVQNVGTRNIKQIARSCSLDISETSRIKDMLGLLSLYFDKPLILINRQLDKRTKQMVCGYALGHCLERQMLTAPHSFKKFLAIKDKHIFTSYNLHFCCIRISTQLYFNIPKRFSSLISHYYYSSIKLPYSKITSAPNIRSRYSLNCSFVGIVIKIANLFSAREQQT